MLKHHEDALKHHIDAVAWKGFSFVEWWQLKAWYGLERLSKNVWRDLRDRFDEAAEDNTAELWIYEAETGIMLIHSDGLQKISDKVGASA